MNAHFNFNDGSGCCGVTIVTIIICFIAVVYIAKICNQKSIKKRKK